MKKFRLILLLLIICNGFSIAFAQNRGVVVRVKENGYTKLKLLYKASYALVIGNSNYDTWNNLPGVKSDVDAVEKILVKHGFVVEKALDLTKSEFRSKLDKFISDYGQEPDNRLLIYYAGHGYTASRLDGKGNLGYLVMKDAPIVPKVDLSKPLPYKTLGKFRLGAVEMTTIQSSATSIQSKHVLFVFDSCFSGTALYRNEPSIPPYIGAEEIKPVRAYLTSGDESQIVPDTSTFRRKFVEALGGAADLDKDGYILGAELQLYVKKEVTRDTNNDQTPLYGKQVGFNRGDFIFVLKNDYSIKPPCRPTDKECISAITINPVNEVDPILGEKNSYAQIQNSKNKEEFRRFLEIYPSGANAKNARTKLEQLWWNELKQNQNRQELLKFIEKFPNGQFNKEARFKLSRMDNSTEITVLTDLEQAKPMTFKNSIGMEFVRIQAGTFTMGATNGEKNENPIRSIKLTKPFYLGKFEVTQSEWKRVMGNNPSYFGRCGANCPVEDVSWEDVQAFLKKLSQIEGRYYRLPTEAEWEYAAKAGSNNPYQFGNTITQLNANVNDRAKGTRNNPNYKGKTTRVGLYKPNEWGLYDMHGNVWEWVWDYYDGSTAILMETSQVFRKKIESQFGNSQTFGNLFRLILAVESFRLVFPPLRL